MRKITLANLRANPVRFIATMLAIIVGTAFLAGTLVLGDSLSIALRSNAVLALKGVDAAVGPNLQDQVGRGRRRAGPLTDAGIPATVLAPVQTTPGVSAAAGTISSELNVLGDDGQVLLKNATGSVYVPVASLSPHRVVEGSPPEAAGQITIDQTTAKQHRWPIGTRLQLATTSGQKPVEVVGFTRYGEQSASGSNGDIVVSQADGFEFLTSGREVYDSIFVKADPGVSAASLTTSLQATVGDQYTVQSGDELRADAAGSAASLADTLGTGLQIFAYIALFVGCFIIYNTFTIVVAQRVREFALLRAIGASGKQVRRAVLLEATIVGLVASAIGMLIGIGLFIALKDLVPQFKEIVGSGDVALRVKPTTVLQVIVIGTIITVVSAFIPAFRAARIRPIAALRIAAVDRSATNRFRAVTGLVGIVLGVVVLLVGAAVDSAWFIPFGVGVLFLGLLIGGPVLASGFSSALGVVLGRLGMPSRLAVANAKRNPSRTATTANALLIGVFLVVFVTAAGGAVRDYAVAQISQFSGADLNVAASSAGIGPDLQEQIMATPGISQSVPVYDLIAVTKGGDGVPVSAGDFQQLGAVLGLKVSEGSLDTLTDDQIAVTKGFSGAAVPKLGETVTVGFKSGATRDFTVGAIIQLSLDAPGYIVSANAATAAIPELLPNKIAIAAEPGQLNAVKASLDALTLPYSSISVQPGNAFALIIKGIFNALISSVNALLALAVVIAVFGIVNTLILSVTERTTEIGLLRSVGMSRRQLRSSIRSESIIVATDGTLIGIAFGLFVAWVVTKPLFTNGSSFSWPWTEMAVIAILGVVIGVVAAIIPAWRASRLNVLEAVRSE